MPRLMNICINLSNTRTFTRPYVCLSKTRVKAQGGRLLERMRKSLQSRYQVHDDAHHKSDSRSFQTGIQESENGGCGGVQSSNSPPWLHVPIDSEEGRGMHPLRWNLNFAFSSHLLWKHSCNQPAHPVQMCFSVDLPAQVYPGCLELTPWARVLAQEEQFYPPGIGSSHSPDKLAVLPLLMGTVPRFTSPALLPPAPIQFQSHITRSARVTWPASAWRVHPSVRTTCKRSKELQIFRGEGMLGDPSISLSFRRGN